MASWWTPCCAAASPALPGPACASDTQNQRDASRLLCTQCLTSAAWVLTCAHTQSRRAWCKHAGNHQSCLVLHVLDDICLMHTVRASGKARTRLVSGGRGVADWKPACLAFGRLIGRGKRGAVCLCPTCFVSEVFLMSACEVHDAGPHTRGLHHTLSYNL